MDRDTFNKLIKEICEGNHGAFYKIFEEYEVKLKKVAFRIIKDIHLADDIFNDVMLEILYGNIRKAVEKPNSFMFKLTENIAKRYLKDNIKRNTSVFLDEITTETAATNDDYIDIEVMTIIDKLENKQLREIVMKKLVMEDTFDEISKDLKRSKPPTQRGPCRSRL